MSLQQQIGHYSEQFEPAFARLKLPAHDNTVLYSPLDIAFHRTARAASVTATDGETLIWRCGVVAMAVGLMDSEGQPPAIGGGGSYKPVTIAHGAGELVLTDQRLLLLLSRAESLLGNVNAAKGTVLATTMPFTHVESVSVARKTGFTGKQKDIRASVECVSHVAALVFTDVLTEIGEQLQIPSSGTPFQSLADSVVTAAARGRLDHSPTPEERDLIERALNGERTPVDNEIVARLAL
ncbi:hypothetical protein OG548_30775 [Streptomyces sp. NBC_01356]|uniref:hypothetical protein n=1 Tax=Streptomyces sp. NBC_01356 TaxID=2903836 RepID=UPI002E348567|nr:hypothetical protein [Streptomyces sp. NBC_01356]